MLQLKKNFCIAVASALAVLSGGCSAIIISGCSDIARVETLEKWQENVNARLDEVNASLLELANNDRVTSINQLPDGQGYEIIFARHGKIVIKNGVDGRNYISEVVETSAEAVTLKMADGTEIVLHRQTKDLSIGIANGKAFRWTRENSAITVALPADLTEQEFGVMTAEVTIITDDMDVHTKAIIGGNVSDQWGYRLTPPLFDANGVVIPGSCTIALDAPEDKLIQGMLRVVMVDNQGIPHSASCVVKREIVPGDMLMKSGMIMDPDDVSPSRKSDMLAIVFTTDTSRMDRAAVEAGYCHGTALGLRSKLYSEVKDQMAWSNDRDRDPAFPIYRRPNEYYYHPTGYTNTNIIRQQPNWHDNYEAFADAVDNLNQPAPKNTTGWFLPSAAEWLDIIQVLGQHDLSEWLADTEENEDYSRWAIYFDGTQALIALNNALSTAGEGNFVPIEPIYYWTATPFEGAAWFVHWNGAQTKVSYGVKHSVHASDVKFGVRSAISF